MTTTDTPRTDAEIFSIQDCNGQLLNIVTPMFAKKLERELAEAKAERDEWAERWAELSRAGLTDVIRIGKELAVTKNLLDAKRKDVGKGLELADEWAEKCVKAEAERYVLLKENERLKAMPHFHHESYCRKCQEKLHEVVTNNG